MTGIDYPVRGSMTVLTRTRVVRRSACVFLMLGLFPAALRHSGFPVFSWVGIQRGLNIFTHIYAWRRRFAGSWLVTTTCAQTFWKVARMTNLSSSRTSVRRHMCQPLPSLKSETIMLNSRRLNLGWSRHAHEPSRG